MNEKHNKHYFETDVYPFWTDKAIAEIELSDESAEIRFPKEIKVIREVTADPSYQNAKLSKRQAGKNELEHMTTTVQKGGIFIWMGS